MALEILIILLLIIANGIFAMAEIAVISSRKVRLQQRANEGDAKARAALELANAPNQFLSTIQIGITLVGVLAGAFGGATIAQELAAELDRVPLLAPYSRAIGVGVVVLCVTYLSLVIGELAPKRLALNSPERIAAAIAKPMQTLSTVAFPLVRLLSVSTETVLHVLRVRQTSEPPVTEEEITALLEEGIQAGVFEKPERDMVEHVFHLVDREVSTLMTPRPEIVWFDVGDSPEEIRQKVAGAVHSRFPVAQGNLDNVLGVVYTKELLARNLADKPVDLRASLRQPLFVPENTRALNLLESFKRFGTHIALVINEYGGVEGLATVNDILEAIVGDIPSVYKPSESQAVQRGDGSWLLDGMLPVEEFKECLNINELPGEKKRSYQTVGGFIMTYLGRIPSAGDHFEWQGVRFEVVDMDRHRIDKVLVVPDDTTS